MLHCSCTLLCPPLLLNFLLALSLLIFIRCIHCYRFPFPFPFSLISLLYAMESGRVLLARFVEVTTSDMYKRVPVVSLEVRYLLNWVIKHRCSSCEDHLHNLKKNVDTQYNLSGKSVLARSPNQFLKEIGTKQVRLFQRASLSVHTYKHEGQRARQGFFRRFLEGQCPVTFLNRGQYLQSMLSSTAGISSSIWTMKGPSTFKALIVLHSISLMNTSFANKTLDCTRTTVAGTLIEYISQKITKAWNALVHTSGIRLLSKMVSSHFRFSHTPSVFEIFLTKKDGYAPILQTNDIAECTSSLNKNEEAAVEMWNRLADVDECWYI